MYMYAKYQWHTKCHKFRWRSHDVPVPNTTEVYKYIRRLLTMGSIPNSKRTSNRHTLSLKKNYLKLVLSWRCFPEIVHLTCTARGHVYIIGTNCCVTSCETAVVLEVCDTYFEARSTFVNWYVHVVRDGEVDPTLNLFSDEVILYCSVHVNLWHTVMVFPC
jgi:hypothetical protein